MESLLDQGIDLHGISLEAAAAVSRGASNATSILDEGGQGEPTSKEYLAIAGKDTAGTFGGRTSGYESTTMQAVEDLQFTLRGFLAKVSAAFESAGGSRAACSVCWQDIIYVNAHRCAGADRISSHHQRPMAKVTRAEYCRRTWSFAKATALVWSCESVALSVS